MSVKAMPDWLRYVRDNSSVRAKDFASALGITVSNLNYRIMVGEIPSPDYRVEKFVFEVPDRLDVRNARSRNTRCWLAGTVKRQFRSEQQ